MRFEQIVPAPFLYKRAKVHAVCEGDKSRVLLKGNEEEAAASS